LTIEFVTFLMKTFWKNINSTCCYETTTCTRLKYLSKNSTWSFMSFVASLYNSSYQRGEGTLSPIEIVITHITFYNYVFWQHVYITSWIIFACLKYIWLDLYLEYSKYSKTWTYKIYLWQMNMSKLLLSLSYNYIILQCIPKTSWKKSNSFLKPKKKIKIPFMSTLLYS
jgi:hypothetical protein